MKLDSVRGLKQEMIESMVTPLTTASAARGLAVAATAMSSTPSRPRTLALGVTRGRRASDYRLAVRVQRTHDLNHQVEQIRAKARGEVDVRFVGRISKRAKRAAKKQAACGPEKFQKRTRPLIIGLSLGHFAITAGTLGAFVTSTSGDGVPLLLSNNHVLGNENNASPGDVILQPGPIDGGRKNRDVIAKLTQFVQLKTRGANFVDCAVAALEDGIEFDPATLCALSPLTGEMDPELNLAVAKVGRTTGLTRGRITAIELDNLVVSFDAGNIRFDNQLEIESSGDGVFSDGGDSGSLIVADDGAESWAVGLLFAGSESGGSNGLGLTFANPIDAVFKALKVQLL